MKTRILAAAAAASLLLTGCAGLLDRDYVSVTVHSTTPATEGDNSALRAESYQELVNILTYLVFQNMPSASIRLYESEDVQADLERACVEVAQEYPLGAYAVDYIQYHVSPILSYHEAEVQITYRRTKEQMDAIVSATGITAIRSQLESALEQFSPECTLSISYFDGGVEDIQALFRQAYFAVPDAAEDLPDVSVSLYPDSGRQRIVELELNYHLSQEELLRAAGDHPLSVPGAGPGPEELHRRPGASPPRDRPSCGCAATPPTGAARPIWPSPMAGPTARGWPCSWPPCASSWTWTAWWWKAARMAVPTSGTWYPLRTAGGIWTWPWWKTGSPPIRPTPR